MGQQIIQQPDGRLCVFSTIVDQIVVADATAEELADYYAEQAAEDARRETKRLTEAVLSGDPRSVYYQFVKTYGTAVELHREHGGEETMICTIENAEGTQ